MLRLAILLLAVALPAQDGWRLPPAGAAFYRRELRATAAEAASRREAEALDPQAAVPAHYLSPLQPAPVLCQGELRDDQLAVGERPVDLGDVLRLLAFDLSSRRDVRLRLCRVPPFGDLLLTGSIEPGNGTESLHCRVQRAEPELLPGESKAMLAAFVRPQFDVDCSGSIELVRRVDRERGVVTEYYGTCTLLAREADDRWLRLRVVDDCRLAAVRENQDAQFRQDVAEAIRSGARWLQRELRARGGRLLAAAAADDDRSYGSGRLALGLLTLLKCDVAADDAAIRQGFAELRRRELIDSYSLGIALMALEALYAPVGERDRLLSGALAAPEPRLLPPADRELAAGWLQRLLANVDSRIDPGYLLRFNYVPGPRYDHSVGQYAMLGLHSARLCGLEVPKGHWRAAAEHYLRAQADDQGRSLRLSLVSYRELQAAAAGGSPTQAGAAKVPARGFAYQEPTRPPYGSMTTAGIAGLVIAEAGLLGSGQQRADVLPKVDQAVRQGFAWLAAEFTARDNPGRTGARRSHWYYYLYGVERACELFGVARLQGRDWYFEGALQLLAQQQPNGSFRPESGRGQAFDSTCFALLFLKKATLPAVTGK